MNTYVSYSHTAQSDSGVCEKKDACADFKSDLPKAPLPPISRLAERYSHPFTKSVFFFADRDTPDTHAPNIEILGSGEGSARRSK